RVLRDAGPHAQARDAPRAGPRLQDPEEDEPHHGRAQGERVRRVHSKGQKVNPHGLRVGVIKDWDSRWFTSKREFGDTLVEDYKIRKLLKKQLFAAGVPQIEIERTFDSTGKPRVRVTIHCAKPGMVIGKGGAEKEKLQAQLSKYLGKDVYVNIVEVRNADVNAQLVAENIAGQLERRISFRRAMKQCMGRAMRMGAKGIKTQVGGRLAGADIA